MSIQLRSLLVLAAVVAPFTLLRFSFFGVSEAIVVGVVFHQLCQPLRRSALAQFPLTRFWLIFVSMAFVGMAINWVFADRPTSTPNQVAFDLGAYILVLGACFALERLSSHSNFDVQAFARGVFLWSGTAFCVLFVASLFVDSLFGLPLKYYNYFVPLAENLHQISLSLVPLPFIGLALLRSERSNPRRILIFALIPALAFFAISTGSAKAVIAFAVGAFVYGYARAMRAFGSRNLVAVNLVFLILFVVVIAAFDWVRVGEMMFESEDVGGARDFLYSRAFELSLNSPIFGRGPGSHVIANGEFVDAHQTLLTLALQAGMVGVVAFVWLVVSAARRLLFEPELLAALFTILVYAAGGDILRRLPAWIMMFIIFHYHQRGRGLGADLRSTRRAQ